MTAASSVRLAVVLGLPLVIDGQARLALAPQHGGETALAAGAFALDGDGNVSGRHGADLPMVRLAEAPAGRRRRRPP